MVLWRRQSRWILCSLALLAPLTSIKAQVTVMTIGDSLTEEYHFEFPFSAPDSDPTNANTFNWVEILMSQRSSEITFGDYEQTQLAYPDYRRSGYEYNWGIPGYDSVMWQDIITAGFGFNFEYASRIKMREQYDEVAVIVIMVGGNDVRANYGDLYDPEPGDITPAQFKATVLTNLGKIIDEIRDVNSTVPIILADIPDLTAAPDIIADHPDATKRAGVTVIVNQLNQEIATLVTDKNTALPPVLLAPVSVLTDQLLSPSPFYIGAIEMINDKDPTRENRPRYLFCKEGLHPSTNGQAIIANVMIDAINTATGSSIEKLPSREVITDLLGLNPDQPYLDWAITNNLTDTTMTADFDGDGISNLGEYILGLDPLVVNDDHIAKVENISGTDYLTLRYTPDVNALRLADGVIKYSTTLAVDGWLDLPNGTLIDLNNGSFEARLPIDSLPGGADRAFLRMEFPLKP